MGVKNRHKGLPCHSSLGLQPYLKLIERYEMKQHLSPIIPCLLTKQRQTQQALLLNVWTNGLHVLRKMFLLFTVD